VVTKELQYVRTFLGVILQSEITALYSTEIVIANCHQIKCYFTKLVICQWWS
jgi:hypothetical protein